MSNEKEGDATAHVCALRDIGGSIISAASAPEFQQEHGLDVSYCVVVFSESCDCMAAMVMSPEDARRAARALLAGADAMENSRKSGSAGKPS